MSREDRPRQDPIAPGHGGPDLEIRLDMGEEADDRDVSEVRVVFDLPNCLNRLAAGGVQVNDQERRLFRQGPGDHLVLTSREQERDAKLFGRLADLGGEEEVVYCNQYRPVHGRAELSRPQYQGANRPVFATSSMRGWASQTHFTSKKVGAGSLQIGMSWQCQYVRMRVRRVGLRSSSRSCFPVNGH